MCYFRSKPIYKLQSHEAIEYRIEWNEDALHQDETGCQTIFKAKCYLENGKVVPIGEAKTVAESQKQIDQYHGATLPQSIWIQYCCSLLSNGNKYLIYETWDSSSSKYIVSVSRDNGKHIYSYAEVSEDVLFDALTVSSRNLPSEILDIAKEDVRSGILDKYIDEKNQFVIDEYISDGTQRLLQEIWHRQGSRRTFPVILYLVFKALVSNDGTIALPSFNASGEICLLLRGHIANNQYEISTYLKCFGEIWKFGAESLYINGENIISTLRRADEGYITKSCSREWREDTISYNQSMIICKLPKSFHDVAKAFLEKNEINL